MGKKAQYYRARIEYLACLPEIEESVKSGARIRMIYDMLKEKLIITMSYPNFCKYVSGRMPGVKGVLPARSRKQKGNAPAVPAPSQAAPGILPQGAGGAGPETPSGDRSPVLKSSSASVRTVPGNPGQNPLSVAETFRPREVRPGDFRKGN